MDCERTRGPKSGGSGTLTMRCVISAVSWLLLLSTTKAIGSGRAVEPYKFFHEYIGLNDEQIQTVRNEKALGKYWSQGLLTRSSS